MENLTNLTAQMSGQNNEVGNMSREQFEEINDSAAEKVAAIEPQIKSFSESDWQLLLQVAVGGTRQLELSKVAKDMAQSDDVLALAEAEVDEQTGLSDKLKEFASTKGLTLPSAPDEHTQQMVEKLKNLSGTEFDVVYVRMSGVVGHETLDAVMSKVETEAEDADLLNLAAAAHPLILVHLQVSNAILQKLPE